MPREAAEFFRRRLPHLQPAYATFFVTFRLAGARPSESGSRPSQQWLGDAAVAPLICDALHGLDGKLYDLCAFCIMPDHVHVVMTPLEQTPGACHSLSKILRSLKGATAREANLALGRSGSFWQHESYDHWVRNEEERDRIVLYVVSNPVRAGLVCHWRDWRWTYWREVDACGG